MLKIACDPIYRHPLPEGHRFPMLKYELIPEQLIYEGTCTEENFFSPKEVDKYWVLGVHDEKYFNDLLYKLTISRVKKEWFSYVKK